MNNVVLIWWRTVVNNVELRRWSPMMDDCGSRGIARRDTWCCRRCGVMRIIHVFLTEIKRGGALHSQKYHWIQTESYKNILTTTEMMKVKICNFVSRLMNLAVSRTSRFKFSHHYASCGLSGFYRTLPPAVIVIFTL